MRPSSPSPRPARPWSFPGNFCADVGCQPADIEFTAGAEDNDPPPATEIASFDVYDYPDFKSSGGDCATDSDLAWFFDLTAPALASGESPRILTLERAADASFSKGSEVVSTFVNDTSVGLTERDMAAILGGKSAPEAFCFRVSTMDAAGNGGGVSQVVCKPCNYRVESGAQPSSRPPEPGWTAADVFPGGTCDAGTGGGGAGGSGGTGGSAARVGTKGMTRVQRRRGRRRRRRVGRVRGDDGRPWRGPSRRVEEAISSLSGVRARGRRGTRARAGGRRRLRGRRLGARRGRLVRRVAPDDGGAPGNW